jgi:hypothetical protein
MSRSRSRERNIGGPKYSNINNSSSRSSRPNQSYNHRQDRDSERIDGHQGHDYRNRDRDRDGEIIKERSENSERVQHSNMQNFHRTAPAAGQTSTATTTTAAPLLLPSCLTGSAPHTGMKSDNFKRQLVGKTSQD